MPSERYNPNDPKQRLQDIVDRFALIREFIRGVNRDAFLRDKKTQHAVARVVEEICEAAYWFAKNKNGKEILEKYRNVNFEVFGDAGNVLRHSYWGIDYGRLWDDLHAGSDIAAVEKMLEHEIPFYRRVFDEGGVD